jgi:hypothetical protein
MRKSSILFTITAVLPLTPAMPQSASPPPGAPPAVSVGATSGGQTPEPNGEISSSALDRYNTANQIDQYMQREQVGRFDEVSPSGRKLGRPRPATAKDLAQGLTVNDRSGAAIATVVSVAPDGVVLSDGKMKVKVPADAFGHNNAGLLLDTTKSDFQQMVTKANAAS